METISTAVPRSRSATMRRWMNSIDPTSTPRVGWEAMNSVRGRPSSRAITTFCWLPPDSVTTAESTDPVRMSYSDTAERAFSPMAPSRSEGPAANSRSR